MLIFELRHDHLFISKFDPWICVCVGSVHRSERRYSSVQGCRHICVDGNCQRDCKYWNRIYIARVIDLNFVTCQFWIVDLLDESDRGCFGKALGDCGSRMLGDDVRVVVWIVDVVIIGGRN